MSTQEESLKEDEATGLEIAGEKKTMKLLD